LNPSEEVSRQILGLENDNRHKLADPNSRHYRCGPKSESPRLSKDDRVSRIIRKTGNAAGVIVVQEDERSGKRRKHAGAHDIGRGFARRLINASISAETLKVVLHHRDFATTEKHYGVTRSSQNIETNRRLFQLWSLAAICELKSADVRSGMGHIVLLASDVNSCLLVHLLWSYLSWLPTSHRWTSTATLPTSMSWETTSVHLGDTVFPRHLSTVPAPSPVHPVRERLPFGRY